MWLYHQLQACVLLLVLGILVAPSVQQEGQAGVYWLFPNSDGKFTAHHNDVVNVTWISPFATPTLVTFCKSTKSVDQVGSESAPGYNASVLIKLDYTHDDGNCWFDLKPDLTGGKGSNSEQFSYISEDGNAATIGLLSSSTALASTATTSDTTSTSSSSTQTLTSSAMTTEGSGDDAQTTATRTNLAATNTAITATLSSVSKETEVASAGLSTGAQAGIGVGVGLVGVAVGAFAVLMFLRKRRRDTGSNKKFHASGGSNAASPPYYQTSEYGGSLMTYNNQSPMAPVATPDTSKYVFPPAQVERHELPHTYSPQELEGSSHPAQELPASRYY